MTNFPKALKRYLPILTWSRDYNRDAFISDAVAAVIVFENISDNPAVESHRLDGEAGDRPHVRSGKIFFFTVLYPCDRP